MGPWLTPPFIIPIIIALLVAVRIVYLAYL
jgi:hypothetical protein